MIAEIGERRTCSICGAQRPVSREFCPVCLLRGGLDEESQDEASADREGIEPILQEGAHRFDHYELAIGENGRPIELGRGAMGITYKGFDVNLRYPVTLKVISETYLSNESARLRFLREARAAASVRHPNVASVFHLGRTGDNCFYAMEFVEGRRSKGLSSAQARLKQSSPSKLRDRSRPVWLPCTNKGSFTATLSQAILW